VVSSQPSIDSGLVNSRSAGNLVNIDINNLFEQGEGSVKRRFSRSEKSSGGIELSLKIISGVLERLGLSVAVIF